jgi:hypothetical protein
LIGASVPLPVSIDEPGLARKLALYYVKESVKLAFEVQALNDRVGKLRSPSATSERNDIAKLNSRRDIANTISPINWAALRSSSS